MLKRSPSFSIEVTKRIKVESSNAEPPITIHPLVPMFPHKFVAVMKYCNMGFDQFFHGSDDGYGLFLLLDEMDGHDVKTFFEDIYMATGMYDEGKILDMLGPTSTSEERKKLLEAFLFLEDRTLCHVKGIFWFWIVEADNRENDLKYFLQFAPDSSYTDEYTALFDSYGEGKGPSLRELLLLE